MKTKIGSPKKHRSLPKWNDPKYPAAYRALMRKLGRRRNKQIRKRIGDTVEAKYGAWMESWTPNSTGLTLARGL